MRKKNKIPALLQPDGRGMWTQTINSMDMHMTPNREFLKVRVKRLFGIKEYHFKTYQLSLGQYGNDIDTALLNPDKIDFFCSRLHICCKVQSDENKRLCDQLDQLKKEQEPLKTQIRELKDSIGKVIVFLSNLEKTEAKKIIDELTKSTSQITV